MSGASRTVLPSILRVSRLSFATAEYSCQSLPGLKIAWLMGVVIAVGMFAGFVLSRTTGLPSYHRHDWPAIQVIALVAEVAYVVLALAAVAQWRRQRR